MYESFADYYDFLMDSDETYEAWKQFIMQNVPHAKTILELGCGTGTLAVMMAKDGIEWVGTDISEDMLSIARFKAIEAGKNIFWAVADMRDFHVPNRFDCVLCLRDSLNYIHDPEEIKQVFTHTYEALLDEGTFIFDVHTMQRIAEFEEPYIEEDTFEGFSYSWRIESKEKGYVQHSLYLKDETLNPPKTSNEVHIQRTFETEDYIRWLKEVGFSEIKGYTDFNQEGFLLGNRHLYVARKVKP